MSLRKKATFITACALTFFSVTALAQETTQNSSDTTRVSFFAIGDVLMHQALYAACEKDSSKCNYDSFFAEWKSDIESADYACVNQETILVPRSKGYSTYPQFGSPEQVGTAEIDAGFDIITHATNHTMDRKAEHVDYTLNFWKDKPVTVLGIHSTAEDQKNIRYDEKKGIRFAFLNFTYGLNGQVMPKKRQYLVDLQDSQNVWLERIKEADQNANIVVVFLHVGTEYMLQPSADEQKKVAKAIDAGADIVVCAHPHVIEPYGVLETSKGNKGLVYWSLGNYISNQKHLETILGGVAKFEVQKIADPSGNTSFEISKASFEGSVTHVDKNGFRGIPLQKYDEELFKTHLWKGVKDFTISKLNELFTKVSEGYAECKTKKAEEALPIKITTINTQPAIQ